MRKLLLVLMLGQYSRDRLSAPPVSVHLFQPLAMSKADLPPSVFLLFITGSFMCSRNSVCLHLSLAADALCLFTSYLPIVCLLFLLFPQWPFPFWPLCILVSSIHLSVELVLVHKAFRTANKHTPCQGPVSLAAFCYNLTSRNYSYIE